MNIQYRKLFLKDLKNLKGSLIYDRVMQLVFTSLPEANSLKDIAGVTAMKGYPNRYRIRLGNYRIGVEVRGDRVEVIRVLHRGQFYRYFP